MVIIVVVGAPVGSMVLRPGTVPYLRALFYIMALVQFCLFAALKIKGDATTWAVTTIATASTVLVLIWHSRSLHAR
jgi:hypothetical protein